MVANQVKSPLKRMPKVVDIAVFRPLKQNFTYIVADSQNVDCGDLVEVPFGRALIKGVCVAKPTEQKQKFKYQLKEIHFVFPQEYRLPQKLVKLAIWMSSYYICPLGETLQCLSSPAPLKKPSIVEEVETKALSKGFTLKKMQKKAFDQINDTDVTKPILLHGITGSGKTEVYLKFIEHYLKMGQSCLYLVPEITLTRETLRKLTQRFENVLTFHSGMTAKQRRETWLACRSDKPVLVIGARSSLFSPVQKLGCIIIDEEHDSSFKQDSNPRYHGRDLALVRARDEKARIIMGSATPSLESYTNAKSGKYELVEMLERISPHPLPKVHVVDINEEKMELKRKGTIHFSRQLIQKTNGLKTKKRQAVFLLNRRGFSTLAVCSACGEKVNCEHCSIPLTFYKKKHILRCHHCDYEKSPPSQCSTCKNTQILFRGTGTEKIHDMLEQFFPNHKIIRVDGSNDSGKDIQEKVADFMKGEGDILLGTQIIAKGLDSPNIQLSVAINADLGLNLPDFRSAERDFQMLTQLAGRTGRGETAGECIFQSSAPEHYAIRHAVQQNYKAFFTEEVEYRKHMAYPPFRRIARFVFTATDDKHLRAILIPKIKELRAKAKLLKIEILGPAPAAIERIKNRYRWQMLLKSTHAKHLTEFLNYAAGLFDKMKKVDTILDRDPQNMM